MNILLISGHSPSRVGASGCGYKEHELTIEGVRKIKGYLDNYKVTVDLYDVNKDAFQDCQRGTFKLEKKYDYVFELHFNAHTNSGAHGSECYVTSRETGISVEQGIMKTMSTYFTLRDNDGIFDGVKRTNFLVINTLKNMGISASLLELCFITNKANMDTFVANKESIYKGIAEAIATGFKLAKNDKPVVAPTPTPTPAPTTLVGKTVNLKGYLYSNSNGGGKVSTSLKTGKITKKHTSGSTPYLINDGSGWLSDKDFTVPSETSNTPKPTLTLKVGAKVSYTGYVYANSTGGGRGNRVSGTYKVTIYNKNTYGVHIDSLGWVKASDCKVVG